MARNKIGSQIEKLVAQDDWKAAQRLIESCLVKEPDDHWLWSRLSAVKYEQRDYRGALDAAERAAHIVPDCPLAIWSKAVATEMLGQFREATDLYTWLFRRGLEELRTPDEDADECWEGRDWTFGLLADCLFRMATCLEKMNERDRAIDFYQEFLRVADMKIASIYSRDEALARLNKLMPTKDARRAAAMKWMEDMQLPAG